jgi:hypothetical protein
VMSSACRDLDEANFRSILKLKYFRMNRALISGLEDSCGCLEC